MTWLTAQVVEELQYLLPDVDRIAAVVRGFQAATLPGIMEYGCLRWANESSFPPLPEVIARSTLGMALEEVRSALGLRVSGPPKSPLRRADVQPAEFHVIEAKQDLLCSDWEQYILRFDHSTRSAGFSVPVASRLQLAYFEMADNAVLHAASPVAALVGYQVMDGISQFCVVDVGVGVLRSLTECPDYAHLRVHNEAIKAALQDGTSRRGVAEVDSDSEESSKHLHPNAGC